MGQASGILGLNLKAHIDTTVTRNTDIERFTYALIGKEEQSQEEKARRKNGKIDRRNLISPKEKPAFMFPLA